jgi:galacturan 1,4-alpha-galacturonidase
MMTQMKILFWLILVASITVLVDASPLLKQQTCTPSSARNSSVDDVPAINEALSTCGNGGTIIIPVGETFMIRSPLYFKDCKACNF